jgi:hypothetical protein
MRKEPLQLARARAVHPATDIAVVQVLEAVVHVCIVVVSKDIHRKRIVPHSVSDVVNVRG